MKLRQLLEGSIIDQALSLPEPEVGGDYASEKVKRYIEICTKALDAMKSKDNNDANDAIVADIRDKKKKWGNVDKETAPVKVKQEEPPPEDEEDPKGEPPPEEEEPPPEEEEPPPEEEEEEEEDPPPKKKKVGPAFKKKVKESLETPFERYMK